MGKQKLFLFIVLIISVTNLQYAQISEITRLPVQNVSQSIKEPRHTYKYQRKNTLNQFRDTAIDEIKFNAAEISTGVYIYQMRINDFITSKKMILIK